MKSSRSEEPREEIWLAKGKLGPIRDTENKIEVRPLTIFIGKQGTGKSLLSQLLYFFHNLPYLVRYYDTLAQVRNGEILEVQELVRRILDDLRSRDRAFGVFADNSATIKYRVDGKTLGFNLQSNNRRAYVHKELTETIAAIRTGNPISPPGIALFVPAERIIYSHVRGPSAWEFLAVPRPLTLFADAMELAGDTFNRNWLEGQPDTLEGRRIYQWIWKYLGGEIVRSGDRWKWKFSAEREQKLIDIDMASSGQRANWPLLVLSEALFSWRQEGKIHQPFYLHIEEPEIHLHPAAQVVIVKLLAYLVNQGFRVVVTTHSSTVLYALNNLLVASDLGEYQEPNLPNPAVRLARGSVGAYLFQADGSIRSLIDEETRLISEAEMVEVDEALDIQLNRLEFLRANPPEDMDVEM